MRHYNGEQTNMIIGINTLFLIPNRVGGTEYYTRSFLKHLEEQDKDNSYTVFCNKENFKTFEFKSNKWKKVLCPIKASNRFERILYEQLIFPFVVSAYGCNLLHSFGYFGPVLGNFKKFVTVHDANWKDCPDDVSPLQNFVLNILISLNIYVAKRIITDSEFSKDRLAHYFPRQKDKIEVIPGAIEDEFIDLMKNNNKPIIEGKYLLCVSKFYPHKKIPYLISLFKEIEKIDNHINLVLVGRDGNEEKQVMELIKSSKRITHFEKASYSDLVNLYKNCSAFIFPSTYEGFGYPVYEAAVAKIPIFVGKKDMYQEEISKNLFELSFDVENDAVKIIDNISRTINYPAPQTYSFVTDSLIKLYSRNQTS